MSGIEPVVDHGHADAGAPSLVPRLLGAHIRPGSAAALTRVGPLPLITEPRIRRREARWHVFNEAWFGQRAARIIVQLHRRR